MIILSHRHSDTEILISLYFQKLQSNVCKCHVTWVMEASIYSKSWLLNENAVLVQESRISFFKVRFERVVATSFSSKTRSRMILIVLVSGTFVNGETTSNETRR